jgi:hypothetical protein
MESFSDLTLEIMSGQSLHIGSRNRRIIKGWSMKHKINAPLHENGVHPGIRNLRVTDKLLISNEVVDKIAGIR